MEKERRIDVLLVEDSLDDLELTTYALEAGNNRVRYLHLTDGREAMQYIFSNLSSGEQVLRQGLKVILLNQKLPNVDGLELLKKIRSDERTKMIPVVILSSSKEKNMVSRAYQLGVNSYVVKPTETGKYVKALTALSTYWCMVNQNPNDET